MDDKLSKREIVDRLHAIDLERAVLNEEERMLRELLTEWPDDAIDLLDEEDAPITEPGTPKARTESSQRMAAVRLEPCDACGGTGDGPFGDCEECAGSGANHPNRS